VTVVSVVVLVGSVVVELVVVVRTVGVSSVMVRKPGSISVKVLVVLVVVKKVSVGLTIT